MMFFPDCQRIDAGTSAQEPGLLFCDAFWTEEEYIHAGRITGATRYEEILHLL